MQRFQQYTEQILVEKRICGLKRLSLPAEGPSPAPEMTLVRAGITATSRNNASLFPFLAPFPLSFSNSVREQFSPRHTSALRQIRKIAESPVDAALRSIPVHAEKRTQRSQQWLARREQ